MRADGLGRAAQGTVGTPDTRPYDDKLMRLSEILGAVHYLRELCGSNDGQLWRDRMRELMDTEGSTALRRAKLTRSFNNGYRSYSRTYNSCTPRRRPPSTASSPKAPRSPTTSSRRCRERADLPQTEGGAINR